MNSFELPNGFIYEGKLYKIIYINEMTGVQQDKLANSRYKSGIDHIEPVLTDLVEKVETLEGEKLEVKPEKVVTELLDVNDLQFVLVKLKEITYGELHIKEGIVCPHCEAKQDASIKLDSLEIIDPEKELPNVATLPKSGSEVEFKPMNYASLKRFASDPQKLVDNASTTAASMRVKRIGENDKISVDDLKKLPAKDLKFIHDNAPNSKKIDLHFEHECKKCSQEFEFDLEVFENDFLIR